MTSSAATVRPFDAAGVDLDPVPRARHAGLDRLRGLAIALMLLDHVLIVTGYPSSPLRLTVTRAAMPLFFLIAGHLAGRLTWRIGGIAAVGLLLPLVVPFIDYAPNVLVTYAAGAVALWACGTLPARPRAVCLLALVLVPLTAAANGYALDRGPASYAPVALLGLMGLGQLLPRTVFDFASSLPVWLGRLGRCPLSVYVLSSLLLALVWWLS